MWAWFTGRAVLYVLFTMLAGAQTHHRYRAFTAVCGWLTMATSTWGITLLEGTQITEAAGIPGIPPT